MRSSVVRLTSRSFARTIPRGGAGSAILVLVAPPMASRGGGFAAGSLPRAIPRGGGPRPTGRAGGVPTLLDRPGVGGDHLVPRAGRAGEPLGLFDRVIPA